MRKNVHAAVLRSHGHCVTYTRTPKTRLRISEAAFIAQMSQPAMRRLVASGRVTDQRGFPLGIRQGGTYSVSPSVLREYLHEDRSALREAKLMVLGMIVRGDVSVPSFPTRNGPPPPLTALIEVAS